MSDTEFERLLGKLASPPSILMPGARIADRFVVERLAGAGGMGRVYLAHDELGGGAVALKIVESEHAERFDAEAQMLAELAHPNVVRYVAHGRAAAGERFLAMEWLEGEDLADRLFRERLSVADTLSVARCVAGGLAIAHARGVVHRDIKPSNLFLVGGDPEQVKVLDFGIARPGIRTRSLTATGATIGTVGYMAPEQALGSKDVDASTDVFALGCVLFECLTARPAFHGPQVVAVLAKVLQEEAPRIRDLTPAVPIGLEQLIASMLSKVRDQRPKNGQAVLARLATIDTPTSESPARLAIGRLEQRLVSVVIAQSTDDGAEENPTWPPERQRDELARLHASIAATGAKLQMLANGALLVTLVGRQGASEQAAPAAVCALSLREARPDMCIAVATGCAETTGQLPVGPVIDGAAALLREASAGRIVVDDATAGLLVGRFRVEEQDGHHWLVQRAALEDVRTLLGKRTPCVGRQKELALLDATFAECIDEPVARAILMTGPPGIGKSRLAGEFSGRLADARVVVARGDPVAAGSELSIARQLVRGIVGARPSAAVDAQRRALDAHVRDAAARAFLGELIGLPASESPIAQLTAARSDRVIMQEHVRGAFISLLADTCEGGPLLLVLDDMHWGDSSSATMLRAVMDRVPDAPLMIIALARPEIATALPGFAEDGRVQHVRLTGLSRRALERLAQAVLGDDLEPARLARVCERSEGNALFAEELIRRAAADTDDEAPAFALAMLEARLEALDPDARRLLRAASVFGEVAWEDGIDHLLGEPASGPWAQLLIDQEVLARSAEARFAGQTQLRFRHGLLRDAAYAMLTGEDRCAAHRLAAEWLERAGETDSLVLAGHWSRSDTPEKAAGHYLRAAEGAFMGNSFDAMLELCDRGLAAGASGQVRGELRLLQCEGILWTVGDMGSVATYAEEALEQFPEGSTGRFSALSMVAAGVASGGLFSEVDRVLAHCEQLDVPEGGATTALSGFRLMLVLLHLGRPDLARRIVDALAEVDDADALAEGYRLVARAWYRTFGEGLPNEAKALACVAYERVDAADSEFARSLAGWMLGMATLAAGDTQEAHGVLEDALTRARNAGAKTVVSWATFHLGVAESMLGRPADAIEKLGAVQSSDHIISAMSEAALAQVTLRGGDLERAARHADRALDHTRLRQVRPLALGVRAALDAHEGRKEQARARCKEAMALYAKVGGWPGTDRVLERVLKTIDAGAHTPK